MPLALLSASFKAGLARRGPEPRSWGGLSLPAHTHTRHMTVTEGSRYQPPAEQDFPLVPFIKQPASPGRKRKVRNQQEAGRGEARREQTLRGEALPH